MFLYHGSPNWGLFDVGFKVESRTGARLRAFFTTPDPAVAALYAGPEGVVYRFGQNAGAAHQTLDGRWSEGAQHNSPIDDYHLGVMTDYLRSNGMLRNHSLPYLSAENFYYGGVGSGDTWLRLVHDDAFPPDIPASQREAVAGDLLRLCGYDCLVSYDAADGVQRDFQRRYASVPWSDKAAVGRDKIIRAVIGDDRDYEWVPVVAFMDGVIPGLLKCGEKSASRIFSEVSDGPKDYITQRDFPEWILDEVNYFHPKNEKGKPEYCSMTP